MPICARAALGLLYASAILLGGCAAVPTIPEPVDQGSATIIHVHGARGALSQRETNALLRRLADEMPDATALQRHLAIEEAVAGSPLYTGNRVTITRDGAQTFEAMAEAIRSAQRYIYMEYYILEDVQLGQERLSDLLIERRRAGVAINIIYDGIGSISTPGSLFDRLRSAGIGVRQYNPINPLTALTLNKRDHRKILLTDGERAFVGGVNLSTNYGSGVFGATGSGAVAGPDGEVWHDMDLQIEGPAVMELERLFTEQWHRTGGHASDLPSTPLSATAAGNEVVRIVGSHGGVKHPHFYATMLAALRSANTQILIAASYFAPTHQVKQALIKAARRGVDVQLLLPSHSDSSPAVAVQQSHYTDLLEAGVKIYERGDGIQHSKALVIDGVWSIVGSSNIDHRSVLFNDEVDAVVIGADTGNRLRDFFQHDVGQSEPIDLVQWRERGRLRKWREAFWRLWEWWL